jgi:type IV secretory pathway protease TraF
MDSQGRALLSALPEGIIPPGMALLLAKHPGSFDGRYFGLVPLDALQRVKPVFVFNLKGELP